MKTHHRYARGLCFVGLGVFAAVPLLAFAIENAQQVIATDGYQKNLRTLAMMNKLDANGDHMVSRAELDSYFGKLFDMLDQNHDGTLDRKEWVGATHDKDVISLSNGGYARALSSMEMMRMVDTDNDHSVSKEEFLKTNEAMFDQMGAGESGPIDAQHWVAKHFPG